MLNELFFFMRPRSSSGVMGRSLFFFQLILFISTVLLAKDVESHANSPLLHPHDEDSVEVQYRGAATQYSPYSEWGSGGAKQILDTNFFTMLQLAQEAAEQDADVIVYPEYGLTSSNLGSNRSELRELCQVVPDPGDERRPCGEDITHDNYRMVQALSCLAMELDMYVVVDLAELSIGNLLHTRVHNINSADTKDVSPEEEGPKNPQAPNDEAFVAYNTQVVFDRTGAVVARYRKKNLFLEPEFAYGNESDETALFTTDFGVTFSLQVCFDIMFTRPALNNIVSVGVRDVVMSTAWIDELPFLTAPQIFSSWSKGLEVNLVVSNLYNPSEGELGSGIFHASHNRNPTYTYNVDVNDPVVMIDDIVTSVSGDMMMDFKESEDIIIKKYVKDLMKVIKEIDSLVSDDDSENDSFFHSNEITYDNVGKKVEEIIQNVKHHSLSKEKIDHVLRMLLSDQRKVVEWNRYKNRLACSQMCQHVRHLIKQSRESGLDNSNENENSQDHLPSFYVYNSSNIETDQLNNQTVSFGVIHEAHQFIIHENISFYSYQPLEMNESLFPNRTLRVKSCHLDNFCCEVKYSYPQQDHPVGNSSYTLLVYNGTVSKGSGVYEMWTQVCAVVYCPGSDINSCAPLDAPQSKLNTSFRLQSIQGQFDTKFIYPSMFSLNFTLVDNELWSYAGGSNETDGSSVLSVGGEVDNLLTAAMFGRWYSSDP